MSRNEFLMTTSAALITLVLSACGQGISSDRLTTLERTSWKILGIPQRLTATISFGADGRNTGFAGCNRFFGTYKAQGQSLAIQNIGSTRKLCPAVEMSVERELLKTLAIVNRWQGYAHKIELTAPTNKTIILLTREKNEI